jgi:hypothetical protein
MLQTEALVVLNYSPEEGATNEVGTDGVLKSCMDSTSVNEVRKAQLSKACKPLEFRRVGDRDSQWTQDLRPVKGVLVKLSTFATHRHIVLPGFVFFQSLVERPHDGSQVPILTEVLDLMSLYGPSSRRDRTCQLAPKKTRGPSCQNCVKTYLF